LTTVRKYTSLDDVYVALGREDLPLQYVVEYLTPLLQSRGAVRDIGRPERSLGGKDVYQAASNGNIAHEKNGQQAQVDGESAYPDSVDGTEPHPMEIMVKLANCCCPLPGDVIVGFFNPNKGIIVHRSDCRTLRRSREHTREHMVEVNWLQIAQTHYLAPIIIIAHDRAGLLRDVAAVVADAGINMTAVASTTNASLQKAVITATLEIQAVEQIEPIFTHLRQVKNVVSVDRDLGRRVG
ncbi:MAG TPA: ACT domain-containing protein, partial [Ktedonobacteraceae bacterium]|nr:ACT domain-containing protein [Ktedonobacteraceae bacterium]